jgi:hypothetical protein
MSKKWVRKEELALFASYDVSLCRQSRDRISGVIEEWANPQ